MLRSHAVKSPFLRRAVIALSLLLPAGIAAHARQADACINEVRRDTDEMVQRMVAAEQALGAGKATVAAEAALKDFPKLHTSSKLMQGPSVISGIDPVGTRAQRIAALALVRTEGLLTTSEEFHAATAGERRANLEWSIGILREIVALKKTPAAETDLGEALSKLPETRDEALSLLNQLDKKDLVTSPQAYYVLAELRQAAGDAAGRDAALKRLDGMTKTKAPSDSGGVSRKSKS
jgi:hypothetical protein